MIGEKLRQEVLSLTEMLLLRLGNPSLRSLEKVMAKLEGAEFAYCFGAGELKKNEGFKFIDTLEFGYYDQSHFIRECKRITQLNPKDFLSKLNMDVHDIIIEDL